MPEAELPPDEDARLVALKSLNILDTVREEAFDQLVSVARTIFRVPIALISLVDEDRQWFKASVGIEARETPRSQAICAHAILNDDVLIIPDATLDPRSLDNPLVTGEPGIRFYAGAPIIGSGGHRFGTFCLIDTEPRTFNADEAAELKGLAAVAMELLQYRQDAQLIESERGRAERNERRLRDAIEALPEGFALYDQDDRLTLFNQTYAQMYADSAPAIRHGVKFEELIRYGIEREQYPEAMAHPDGVEAWVRERISSHLNPSEPIEQKLTGGRWLRIQETKTQHNEIVGFRVDISWQKRVSEILQRLQILSSNDQLSYRTKRQGLLELGREIMAFDAGVVWDISDDEVEVATVSGELPGLEIGDRATIKGTLFEAAMASSSPLLLSDIGPDAGLIGPDTKTLLAAPVVLDGETLAILGFVQLSGRTALHDPHRDLIGIMADWLGIEVRRTRAMTALRDAKEEAEQASRSKSRFLAMMSHELRTPMNGVIGILDLLLNSKVDGEQVAMLDLAKHSAESLLVILNDILDFSKLEAGRLDLETVEFDVPTVVADVTGLLATQAGARGLRLLTVLDTDFKHERFGDPTRLRQVLMNLVSNAIKFTRTGAVTIDVTRPADEPDTAILIRVTDTGVGIPEERRGGLFQEFSQLDSSVARQFGGTGLGLAICKRLVDMMRGEIWLEHTGPEGTCFAFSIPLPTVPDDQRGKALKHLVETTSGKKILIVDESPFALSARRRQLEIWGLVVQGAGSLDEARQVIGSFKPDVVLLRETDETDLDAFLNKLSGQGLHIVLEKAREIRDQAAVVQNVDAVLPEPLNPLRLLESLGTTRSEGEHRAVVQSSRSTQLVRSSRALDILVAEDNPVNQSLMQRALERMGHHSTIVSNGLEAYETCRKGAFDVVLMDIEMPEMDGMEAVRWIRERMEDTAPPMIAMTAHALEGNRDWLIQSGFDDYLSKPLKLADLQAVLNGLAGNDGEVTPEPASGSEATGDPAGLIDEQRIDELLGVLPVDVFGQMSEQFLDSADDYVTALGTAIASSNVDDARRSAHAIKGLALNFGAVSMAEIAARIESAARDDEMTDAPNEFSRLTDVAVRTRKQLLVKISEMN